MSTCPRRCVHAPHRRHAGQLLDDGVGASQVGRLGGVLACVDGAVDVGPPELDRRSERFEDDDRLLPGGDRLGPAAEAPHHRAQAAQVVTLAEPVAESTPQLQGPLSSLRRLLPGVHEAQLQGERVEQLGLAARTEPVGAANRPVVLGGRLPMGALDGRGVPRAAGVVKGQVVGAAVLRVVRQPRVVRAAPPQQLVEDRSVRRGAAVRRDGPVDRTAGDVVAEAKSRAVADEESGVHQLVEILHRDAGGGAEQRRLDPRPHERRDVEGAPRRAAQGGGPGEHRIPGRRRDDRRPGAHDLADEERVPAGEAVQLGGLQVGALDESGHGLARQGRHVDAAGRALCREVAEGHPDGIGHAEGVVAVGRDDQHGQAAQPPPQVAQHVERRLVGPVQVLEHHDGRTRGAQPLPERGEELLSGRVPAHRRPRRAAQQLGDLDDGAQWAWRELAVAPTPQPPGVGLRLTHGRLDGLDQRRLADPGLPGDQHEAAVTGAGLRRIRDEGLDLRAAFEQAHPADCAPGASP